MGASPRTEAWREEQSNKMKPYIIVHMATSLDGRTLPSRWSPQRDNATAHYDRLHGELGGEAWLVGRTTGQEFAKRDAYPSQTAETYPRTPWLPKQGASAYGVVLDAHGKIAWGRADIGGDPDRRRAHRARLGCAPRGAARRRRVVLLCG
jgi:hypothetical protein